MVLTRQEAQAAFNHVLDNVIGCGDNSPLKSALQHEGFDDIFALITISDEDIDSLSYKDPSNASSFIPIPGGDKNLVRIFRHYVIHRNASGDLINDNWIGITQTDFDAFRVDPTFLATFVEQARSSPQEPSAPVSIASTGTKKQPPADLNSGKIKQEPTPSLSLKNKGPQPVANQADAQAQKVSVVLETKQEQQGHQVSTSSDISTTCSHQTFNPNPSTLQPQISNLKI